MGKLYLATRIGENEIRCNPLFSPYGACISKSILIAYGWFPHTRSHMTPQDVAATIKIASVQIHVERKRQRIKSSKLIGHEIENNMFDCLEQLIFVCAILTNFESALVA